MEGVIGFGRRKMSRYESFEALNTWLEGQCLKRQDAVLRGHKEMVGERLMRDLEALMVLPEVPYDACDKLSARASSISMVHYRQRLLGPSGLCASRGPCPQLCR